MTKSHRMSTKSTECSLHSEEYYGKVDLKALKKMGY